MTTLNQEQDLFEQFQSSRSSIIGTAFNAVKGLFTSGPEMTDEQRIAYDMVNGGERPHIDKSYTKARL